MRGVNAETDRGSKSLSLFGGRWAKMAGLIIAAIPLITRAGGAVLALVSSLARAAGGAGVIGGGAIGLAVVGFGSLIAVAKPLATQLHTTKTAFDAYNKAVDLYGVKSRQAATQAKALNVALKTAPQGTLALLTTVRALGKEWTKETRPARNSLMGLMLYGAQGLRGAGGQLAGIVNANVGALSGGGKTIIDRLLDRSTIRDLGAISAQFRAMVPDMANITGNFLTAFVRLTREAAPYVRGIAHDISLWTDRFDRSTRDTSAMDERFKRWTQEFRSWVSFLGGTKDLLTALLGSATGGNKMLAGITTHFREWAQWIRTNPVRMQRFWQDSLKFGRGFGDVLVYIGKLIFGIGSALAPVEASIAQMLKALGPEFLQTLKQVGQLMASIFGGVGGLGGPLTIFMKILNAVLEGINALVKLIPGLGPLLAAAFTVIGVMKLASWVSTTTSRMLGLTTATNAQVVAQERLAGASMGGLVSGGRGGARGGGFGGLPLIVSGGAGRSSRLRGGALGRILYGSKAEIIGQTESGALVGTAGRAGLLTAGAGLGRFSSLGRALGVGARGIGKFALPITAALGIMDAFTTQRSGSFGHQVEQTAAGVAHGMSFGLIPSIDTPGQKADKAIQQIQSGAVASAAMPSWLSASQRRQITMERRADPGQAFLRGGNLGQRISGLGGGDPRTLRQIAGQIAAYTAALRAAKGLSSDGATSFRAEVRTSLSALRTAQSQIKQANARADFNKAFGLGHDILAGYNVIDAKRGPAAAMKFTVDQTLQHMKELGPRGRKELASGMLDWANEMKKRNPDLTGQVDRLTEGIKTRFAKVGDHIKIVNDKIYSGSTTEWKNISTALMNPTEKAKQSVTANFTIIQQKALGALQAMGYTAAQAGRIVQGIEHGSIAAGGAAASDNLFAPGYTAGAPTRSFTGKGKKARGGRFGGSGLSDSIMVGGDMVAPGELAVNRHSEARADGFLRQFGTSLGQIVGGEALPHSAPRKHALGGRIEATASPSMAGLIHGLLPGTSGLGGVPGAMIDATGLMYAGGMAAGMSKATKGAGGVGGIPGLSGGTSGANQKLGYRMMLRMWPSSQWPALKALWTGESGWNQFAYNKSSGATGIPQSLPGSKMASAGADWQTNPATQIRWGLDYIAGRYGSPSSAYSQWLGRSPHWYGDGGEFTTNGPQMIGVGEKGREHVKITPHGKTQYPTPRAFGVSTPINVPVHIANINYGGSGDVKNVVQRELQAAMREVTREIRNMGVVQEEALLH